MPIPPLLSQQQWYSLKAQLPVADLVAPPTPLVRTSTLSQLLGTQLLVKNEGACGDGKLAMGGNKVRKLNFLLGELHQAGHKEVITFGYAGSNHCTATAVAAHKLGMRSHAYLLPQPNAPYLQRNLRTGLAHGGQYHYFRSKMALKAAVVKLQLGRKLRGQPMLPMIPPGGSSPLGILGIIDAVYELKAQLMREALPVPDLIYVAMGSMGTASGLVVGAQLAGLPTRIIPVQVIGQDSASLRKYRKLVRHTQKYLGKLLTKHGIRPQAPSVPLTEEELRIREGFIGPGYAHFTEGSLAALDLLQQHTSLALDGTYSAKAFAALVLDARQGLLKDRPVLFWNTHNQQDLSHYQNQDTSSLPAGLQAYFTEPVQPLAESR